MKTNCFNNFVGLYPLSKTLRFELIPQGKTREHIKEKGVLVSDKERALEYKRVKSIIDDYHRYFIDKSLAEASINWDDLDEAMTSAQRMKDDVSVNKLRVVQAQKRKEITGLFEIQSEFKDLFKEKLFKEILPEFMKGKDYTEKDIASVEGFARFTTYFVGFYENRKNIYASEDKATAVANRLVNENYPKYYANMQAYRQIEKTASEILQKTEEELKELLGSRPLKTWFTPSGFNATLSQEGIEVYNAILGGYFKEESKLKSRGLNEFANLFRQRNPDVSLPKNKTQMLPLYKQILSDRIGLSFVMDTIDSNQELLGALDSFISRTGNLQIFDRLVRLMKLEQAADADKILINEKDLSYISNLFYSDWNYIKSCLREYKIAEENLNMDVKKNQNIIEKWLKQGAYSVNLIDKSIKFFETTNNSSTSENQLFSYQYSQFTHELIKVCKDKEVALMAMMQSIETGKDLHGSQEDISTIKEYTDAFQEVYHLIKPLHVSNELETDKEFYEEFLQIYEEAYLIVPLYNKIRNYLTKKPYREDKYKLNFENPTLAKGWDKNKERDNTCILLMKDGMYYLGVMNAKNKPKLEEGIVSEPENSYQKMVYKFFKDITTMIPKCTTQMKAVQNHFKISDDDFVLDSDTFAGPFTITKDIFDLNNTLHNGSKKFQDGYLKDTGDENGYKKALTEWIEFCLKFLRSYNSTKDYDYDGLKKAKEYGRLIDFYKEVNQRLYKISYENISPESIHNWIEEGKLFLFKIHNKDYAKGATGRPNLHTLYWEALFSPENLHDIVYKLNGEAELFYREASISKPIRHKVGEKLVNKITIEGDPIPDDIYLELYNHVNYKAKGSLSDDAKSFMKKAVIKDVKHEIVKDRRYTEDKFLFHVPITINFKAEGKPGDINKMVRQCIFQQKEMNVIGIDRGERNLLYISVVDPRGNILLQKSFNTVGNMDYATKLTHREKARDEARKSWKTIEGIKDLKEGYLSQVVHELTKLMIEYNAIVALEDLNFGFKRGRFKIERQVYQKFERMFIEKLNYLIFKDSEENKEGGLLKGYQLTNMFESFEKLGKQSGFLFYVPAAYTSVIDPTTGFINAFDLRNLTNIEKKRDFFSNFLSIKFDEKYDAFIFSFDYAKHKVFQNCAVTKWDVNTQGKRITYSPKTREYQEVYPTDILKQALEQFRIEYKHQGDVLAKILEYTADKANVPLYDALYFALARTLQMRNSNPNTGEDYIISPVMNKDGVYYNSNNIKDDKHPVDADANGAYHIALKGQYLIRAIANNSDKEGNLNRNHMLIRHEDWLEFVQMQQYKK